MPTFLFGVESRYDGGGLLEQQAMVGRLVEDQVVFQQNFFVKNAFDLFAFAVYFHQR